MVQVSPSFSGAVVNIAPELVDTYIAQGWRLVDTETVTQVPAQAPVEEPAPVIADEPVAVEEEKPETRKGRARSAQEDE